MDRFVTRFEFVYISCHIYRKLVLLVYSKCQNTVTVSPDESTVTPPLPQRFPFGRDNFKNILVRTFKFGMWVYMGNATNAIVL